MIRERTVAEAESAAASWPCSAHGDPARAIQGWRAGRGQESAYRVAGLDDRGPQ